MKKLSILLIVVCTGVTVAQAPPNDTCQTSILLPSPGLYPGTTTGATSSIFGTGTCGLAGADVWYRYTATGTGNKLIASTCYPGSSTNSTGVDIFTGACLGPPVTAGCNITWCDNGSGITGGRAVTNTAAGTTYLIRVKTTAGGGGAFQLYVDELAGAGNPQPNGTCGAPVPVINGVNANLSNFGEPGALAVGFSPLCTTAGKDVYFTYLSTATGSTTARTCFLSPTGVPAVRMRDSVVAVYANCAGAPSISCNNDGCNGTPGQGSSLSSVSFPTTAGLTYIIQVAGLGSGTAAQEGTFDLEIIPPPPNDECVSPIALATGPNGPYSNVTASDSPGASGSCGFGNQDLWFTYTPTCGGPTRIDTGCNGFDTLLVVYSSCGGTELACNDNDPTFACGASSVVTVNMTAGQTYVIRVASAFFGISGSFNINVTPGLGLNWLSPLPGTAQFSICNGPPNGTYFLFATLFPGAFPTGWFYGLDITLSEISNQIGFGFPFNAPLNGAGTFTSPVFSPVPSGLTIYSLAFGVPPTATAPSGNSGAKSHTVP